MIKNDMKMKERLNILWTGGLDSTYLVVNLLRMGVILQPYYIIDKDRKSVNKELDAIKNITNTIRSSNNISGVLHDCMFVEKDKIALCPEITASWQALNEKYTLGSQYDWLARFAKQENLKLLVGVQMESRGKVVHTLEGRSLNEFTIGGVSVFSVEGVRGLNRDAQLVFENILFPSLIVGITKVEEWEYLQKMHFGDIAKMTWFCHSPVLGLTCGQCNPCKDALNEGMAFRVNRFGRVLGSLRKLLYRLQYRISTWTT